MNNVENKNLYEVRKTVRFELEPQLKFNYENKDIVNNNFDLNNFIDKYSSFLKLFNEIVFNFNWEKLNWKLKIKYSFLKSYTKNQYYDNKIIKPLKLVNQVEIWSSKKFEYLFQTFSELYKNNFDILNNIKELSQRSLENQSRKSDLAVYFSELSKRTNFVFLYELFNNSLNIENDEVSVKIDKANILTKEIDELIKKIKKSLLPTEVIEKLSFNYYTVNKRKKDYDKEIENKINDFSIQLKDFNPILSITHSWFKNYISDIAEKSTLLTIVDWYNLMKKYKAEQKSNFLKYLDSKSRNEDCDLNIDLFSDILIKPEFNEILDLTKAINILSQVKTDILNLKEANDKNKKNFEIESTLEKYNNNFWTDFWKIERDNFFEKITKLKKLRWDYFFEWNKEKFKFNDYKIFCSEYKKVAKEYWNIKAKIKALQKEKIDAEQTQSWALILEENNNKFLLTIPRDNTNNSENLSEANKKIKYLPSDKNWDIYLNIFDSLTLKALDKLCFWKENNTFRRTIYFNKAEYPEFFNDKWFLKDKFEFSNLVNWQKINDEKLLIKFYKSVLALESTKRQISLKFFTWIEDFLQTNFDTLDEFQEELKKVCYTIIRKTITKQTKDEIINNYQTKLYKITSYDLKKYDEDFIKTLKYKSDLKRKKINNHTQIWLDFWEKENKNNKFPTRLNPEIKISFTQLNLKFIQSNSELFTNRHFGNRLILTSSFTQNAFWKDLDLNFKETQDISNFYEKFNNNFNKNIKPTLKYSYWIDRWENELVSLWIFDLSKDKPEEKWVKIPVYELKTDKFFAYTKTTSTGKNMFPYQNVSYYQYEDFPHYYNEIKYVSCLDLSTAKLINNKIYLNWDIQTYLNLKIVSAKRKIYEIISKSQHKSESLDFDDYNTMIYIDWIKGKNKHIYKHNSKYESILSFDFVKDELKKYIIKVKVDLNDNEEVSIQKVNHLREALCANMVWIIDFLQKIYPGMIYFEEKNEDDRINHFNISNSSLGSKIELKLLQKFASKNFVTPVYKQILTIKDNKKYNIKQLWIIWYVDEKNTSDSCPICWSKLFWHWSFEFENLMHHYTEKYWYNYWDSLDKAKKTTYDICDYHMNDKNYWYFFINSWDDLATYNIAKKWIEYLNSKK